MNPQPGEDPSLPFAGPEDLRQQRARVLALPLEAAESAKERVDARDYVIKLTRDEMADRVYRTNPEISIEEDVLRLLPAYTPEEGNPLLGWQLKAIRRWAMRRYAFCLAEQVHERLRRNEGGERFWLIKDLGLPRTGFAMLLGYGAMLGAGHTVDWLGAFTDLSYWVVLALCSAAIFGLVHVNVRNQIGRNRSTNRRTALVFAICWAWIWIGVGGIAAVSQTGAFRLGHAVICSVVAMLLGILGQFFFTGNKSMADPL